MSYLRLQSPAVDSGGRAKMASIAAWSSARCGALMASTGSWFWMTSPLGAKLGEPRGAFGCFPAFAKAAFVGVITGAMVMACRLAVGSASWDGGTGQLG